MPAPIAPSPPSSSVLAAAPNTRARLVIFASNGSEASSYPIEGQFDIGRTEGDLLMKDPFVSPRHARIVRRNDGYWLVDLGSTNGVYLRIESSSSPEVAAAGTLLTDQDLILVGQQVLKFEVLETSGADFGGASEHGTALFGTPATPRLARLVQRTVEGVARDVFHIRKSETLLGRETGDIVFTDDPFMSKRHALILFERNSQTFRLVDLTSSNGTFLRIRKEVQLARGDDFRIGQKVFRFDGPGTRAPSPLAHP
jgi:pSer/pThr/pTyr-binding forkhead associated (FHA) protein